jgi:methanogenic corrinoid protein MtbC1
LLFALAALGRGYRVIYLGPDLPLDQLPPVVERISAGALVLSASVAPLSIEHLTDLSRELTVPVYVGGAQAQALAEAIRAAGAHPIGHRISQALSELEQLTPAHGTR